MAIKLAQSQDITAKGRQGISPSFLKGGTSAAGSMRAGHINPGAFNVRALQGPTPRIVQDKTDDYAIDFMHSATRSALAYQKREDQAIADMAVAGFADEIHTSFYGKTDADGNYIEGFKDKEKNDAVQGYGAYQQGVDAKMKETLDQLTPQQKQFASMRMYSQRSTILGQAANWKRIQLGELEEQNQHIAQQDAMRALAANPLGMYDKDPATGLSPKEAFYQGFGMDVKAANEAWANVVVDLGEHIYHNGGVEAAKKYEQTIAANELSASPDHTTKLHSNILTWENQAIAKTNALANKAEREKNKLRRETHDKNEVEMEINLSKGVTLDDETLNDMLQTDQISAGYYRTYKNSSRGKDVTTDVDEYIRLENELIQYASTDFKNEEGVSIAHDYMRNPNISKTDKSRLHTLRTTLMNKETTGDVKRGLASIKVWVKGPAWQADIYSKEEELNYIDGSREYTTRLAAGENADTILADMKPRYNKTITSYTQLPSPRFSPKPRNMDDVITAKDELNTRYNDRKITKPEYEQQLSLLIQYSNSLMRTPQDSK